MITTNEIRVGSAFMFEGSPFIVQRMLGQKGGRNGMVTKLRVKNIVTGGTQDLGLDAGEKFEEVELVEKSVQLSYIDGDDFHLLQRCAGWSEIANQHYAHDHLLRAGRERRYFRKIAQARHARYGRGSSRSALLQHRRPHRNRHA